MVKKDAKKKFDGKEYTEKRKKQKSKKTAVDTSETLKAEVLDAKTLREGMLLLGCVVEVRANCFLVSLPGFLVGNVSIANVSAEFTDLLKQCAAGDEEVEEPNLKNIVHSGELYPCKVLRIISSEKLKKPTITLSIDPKDINGELRLQSLYSKMVLFAAVQSVEDHGYVMDIGVKGAQGFLPFSEGERLSVGQVVPTSVKKLPTPKSGNVVWLSKMNHDEAFPEVEEETLKLSSILPGAHVTAYITNVKRPFLYMQCMDFDACANAMTLGKSGHSLTEGTKVSGTVLYVHPISHVIYLFLGSKPTPSTFSNFFRVQKFDLLKKVKFEYPWHSKLVFRIGQGALGFTKKRELPEKGPFSQESLLKTPVVPKARVVFLHYMDNLVQISFKESFLDLEIKKPEEVNVGDIYEGVVKKHSESGMFVQVCPGLSGLVRHIQMSDSLVTMPEKLHPVDSKVKCRVLCMHQEKSGLDLTCKESLLSLPESQLLKSYEEVQKEYSYKGVIVQKKDTHILVLFFNNVKGVVLADQIPESSIFFVGQTVSCSVLYCNPAQEKLTLSLMGDKKKKFTQTQSSSSKQASKTPISSISKALEPIKTHKAIISSITAHQLNLIVDGKSKGRVHITELGSPEENSMPLKKFSVGQAVKVYCLGQYNHRSHTFLHITHQRTKQFLECSLMYPPPMAMGTKILPGMKITGFVKEMSSNCAMLWLSPIQVAVLDYLHFSQNTKVLRKVKKHLKVGLTLNTTVIEVQSRRKDNFFSNIHLTKLDQTVLEAGKNVVGRVESASPEEGVVMQLPHGYLGTVCLTDLQDVYAPVNSLLDKCKKLRYILCHVLEVDSEQKSCFLSLRQSKLYGKEIPEDGCPEICAEDMMLGRHLEGFVRRISNSCIFVTLGRGIEGKITFHKCGSFNCLLCEHTQNTLKKYPVGSVVKVIVNGEKTKKGLYSLVLPELADLEDSSPTRLKVTEDISWDDV